MINIQFNAEELQTLGLLIDTAVKANGINAAKTAVPVYEKLEAAVAAHNAANAAPVEDKEAA